MGWVVALVCLVLYTNDISQTKGKKMANTTKTLRFIKIQEAIHSNASDLNSSKSLTLGYPINEQGVEDQVAAVKALIKTRKLELMRLENSLWELTNSVDDGSLFEYQEHIAAQA